MSNQYPGGFITKSPVAPTSSAASGMWTLDQAMQNQQAGTWPVPIAIGQQEYTSPGTYSWVAPAGVTSVSVVAVGAGAMGGGGLGYKNNYSVTAGSSYTVVVGQGQSCQGTTVAGDSYFVNTSTVRGGGGKPNNNGSSAGGTRTGDGGGNGGAGNPSGYRYGGGGAGGYSGNGGNGDSNGSGGGGGGGGSANYGSTYQAPYDYVYGGGGGGGGGTGIYGSGGSGTAGSIGSGGSGGTGGTAGSSGNNGSSGSGSGVGYGGSGGNGGFPGGGGGLANYSEQFLGGCPTGTYWVGSFGTGADGAVRIIWPGSTRSFPNTNTGNL